MNNYNFIKKYQVIGNPINHSLSPIIHQYFAHQAKINLSYEKKLIDVQENYFEQYVVKFFKQGGLGLNITLPFKHRAYKLANIISQSAEFTQASNTLYYKDNIIYADNTDGLGLVEDIKHHVKFSLKNKNILLIGAGGASQGVLLNLLQQQPSSLIIANRTLVNAQTLIDKIIQTQNFKHIKLQACNLMQLQQNSNLFLNLTIDKFDIIINASSIGMDNQVYDFSIHKSYIKFDTLAYDMIYNKVSPFLLWAKQSNLVHIDGLGMLIQQARFAFNIWHQYMPDAQELYGILNKKPK